jgi:hypothetical protein
MQEFAAAGDSKGYAKHFYSEEEKAGMHSCLLLCRAVAALAVTVFGSG